MVASMKKVTSKLRGFKLTKKTMKKSTTVALISAAAMFTMTGCSMLGGLFGPSLAPGESFINDLKVGDCVILNDPEATVAESVKKIDCSEPHEDEVFHIFQADLSQRPSDEALFDYADEVCTPQFEAYVGTAYEDSSLFTWSFIPLQDAWDDGDRQITCMVSPLDGLLESSVKNSGL